MTLHKHLVGESFGDEVQITLEVNDNKPMIKLAIVDLAGSKTVRITDHDAAAIIKTLIAVSIRFVEIKKTLSLDP